MTNLAIQFDHVGKLYQLGVVGTGTLTHDLNRWWHTKVLHHEDPFLKIGEVNDRSHRGSSDFVWALKDISFNVEQGDVVGIIGKNGAGKSTLLKLLSRITSPTTGVIRAHGRIASLLEVGTGFHPEMTGRENIYMNGAIMGMTRREIASKLDEIVDFAGVERYLDTPVKRYSSGMTVRLGFAVAAFLEPEILVVDEVLAVGDAEFQKKAIGKMQDVSKGQGRTVLFVSHNMAAVRSLCKNGLVLKDGCMDFAGSAEEAVKYYMQDDFFIKEGLIIDKMVNYTDYLTIDTITLNGSPQSYISLHAKQKHLDVCIKGYTQEPIKCEIKLIIKRIDGTPLASCIEGRYKACSIDIYPGTFVFEKHIILPHYIADGDYIVDLHFQHPLVKDYFVAKDCATIHMEGFYELYGRTIVLNHEGFFGLESE